MVGTRDKIMRLRKIRLKNFRSYKEPTEIEFDKLTCIIGKNEAGKSTILEALDIFFNGKTSKISKDDKCVTCTDEQAYITCIFDEHPGTITIDSGSPTSLEDEYLLNETGLLEITKEYNCGLSQPREAIYAVASHPTCDKTCDLLFLKIEQLRKRCEQLKIDTSQIDERSKVEYRRAIREHAMCSTFELQKIPLDKDERKTIYDQIEKHFPIFALFQSDRTSKDEDNEVQDPMKLAIKEALKEVQSELEAITTKVQDKATELAERTLEKLSEMDADIAQTLNPVFKKEPKWDSLFSLSLTSDDNIPINKRGSGIRRLILLNFFRAEAERRLEEKGIANVIYAFEEPETSQHPDNQKMLFESLIELSEAKDTQVIITTHVPGLIALTPSEAIRFIKREGERKEVVTITDDEGIVKSIADELGLIPLHNIKAALFVEGPNDIDAINNFSALYSKHVPGCVNTQSTAEILTIISGGSTLKTWINNHLLKKLNIKEFHFYDRDDKYKPKYKEYCDKVNARGDGSKAWLTEKKEIENYIHPKAIEESLSIKIGKDTFDDFEDIPYIIAKIVHEKSKSPKKWDDLDQGTKSEKASKAKKRLCGDASNKMTIEQLREMDKYDEFLNLFKELYKAVNT